MKSVKYALKVCRENAFKEYYEQPTQPLQRWMQAAGYIPVIRATTMKKAFFILSTDAAI
jgi:hypothetical protein